MTEVLNAQQRANRNLEGQFRKANETQESQTEAMQDMAQVNYQMNHMFASVPIYDGTDPDSFDDWLYQIESCTIPVPVIVLCLSAIFARKINSSELHFQSVALRSQYSDHVPEAVMLH